MDALRKARPGGVAGEGDWRVVEEWYHKDLNSVPPVYVLQPISSKIENYNSVLFD